MALKLTLATDEEIVLAEFGHGHVVVLCDDLDAFRGVEDKLHANGALDAVTVTSDGEEIAKITGMQITGAQTVCNNDGSVTGHIYTRGSSYELDGGVYAQAGRILLGEEG